MENVYFQKGQVCTRARQNRTTHKYCNRTPKNKTIILLLLEYDMCWWRRRQQRPYAGVSDMIYVPSRSTPHLTSFSSLFKCPCSMKPCHSQPPPHPGAPTKYSHTLQTLTHPHDWKINSLARIAPLLFFGSDCNRNHFKLKCLFLANAVFQLCGPDIKE